MPYELDAGDHWLINWNPSTEPDHQDFFDGVVRLLQNGKSHEEFRWRCRINTQREGDPFLFKRGASSKHAGVFAFGTVVKDREDSHGVELKFDFVAPLGEEYSLDKLRVLDPPVLKLVASGHSVSAKTAATVIRELKSTASVAVANVFSEGRIREIRQNSRERNRQAREVCLVHFGDEICQCCGINFVERFGEMGRILHCHHREDLAIRGEGVVNGVEDLVPVCPNCHAMLHHEKPSISVATLSKKIKRIAASTS